LGRGSLKDLRGSLKDLKRIFEGSKRIFEGSLGRDLWKGSLEGIFGEGILGVCPRFSPFFSIAWRDLWGGVNPENETGVRVHNESNGEPLCLRGGGSSRRGDLWGLYE
jgi:hypothetical protein